MRNATIYWTEFITDMAILFSALTLLVFSRNNIHFIILGLLLSAYVILDTSNRLNRLT